MLNLAAIDENKDLITKEYVDGKLIPSGGTSGQVLAKSSGTDYDVGWATPSGSGQRSTTVLYDNPSGSNGNITLSQSAANFDYLKIYTFNTDGVNGCQSYEIHNPDGKYVFLSNIYTSTSHAWTQGRCVYINGTSISTYNNYHGVAQVDGSSTFSTSNFIYIYRVEAWNDEIMNVAFPLPISDISGLQAALDGKAPTGHYHQFLFEPSSSSNLNRVMLTSAGNLRLDERASTSESYADPASGYFAMGSQAPSASAYKTANQVYATPNGSDGLPSMRALVPKDLPVATTWYGTCSTAAATAAKVVTCNGFVLKTGATVTVYHSTASTVRTSSSVAITLNVNSTGAKNIAMRSGTTLRTTAKSSGYSFHYQAGDYITYMYDGTYWVVIGARKSISAPEYRKYTKTSSSVTSSATNVTVTQTLDYGYDLWLTTDARTNGWVGSPYVGSSSFNANTRSASATIWWTHTGSGTASVDFVAKWVGMMPNS